MAFSMIQKRGVNLIWGDPLLLEAFLRYKVSASDRKL